MTHNIREGYTAVAATDRERITALEQQNHSLQAEIAALKSPKPAPKAVPLVEEGVVTTTYSHAIPIERPTTEEYQRLLQIVERKYPQVEVPKSDRERHSYFRDFVASFERLASIRRTDDVDSSASYWVNDASRWLRERGTIATPENGSFWAAVIASSDTAFSFGCSADGVPARFGLTYDTNARKAMPAAWRGVLERGQLLATLNQTPRRLDNQTPAQVRTYS
jgi:hypothetical protein